MDWCEFEESSVLKCQSCHGLLETRKPYIKCVECQPQVFICTECFSRGKEFGQHQNNHSYTVVRHDFPLFDNWTAAEELALVQDVLECGYGNWSEIARRLHPRTETECQHHYDKFYINNPPSPLPKFPDPVIIHHPNPIVFKLSEDPPRPPADSLMAQEMAGYNAARGDFTVEYDNFFEVEISELSLIEEEDDPAYDPVMQELGFAVLDVYQNCLKKRERRKQFLKDYGLLNQKKNLICMRRYPPGMRPWVEGLRPFMRLHSRTEHDEFLESLHRVQVLRKELKELFEYRRNGLQKLHQTEMYQRLKAKREEAASQVSLYREVSDMLESKFLDQSLRGCFGSEGSDRIRPLLFPAARRKAPPPMDISIFPCYEQLSQKEKEICSSLRFRPEDFLKYKTTLCEEYGKYGYLKLSQARSCLKIDVNKTRKLYDFLLSEGMISAEC